MRVRGGLISICILLISATSYAADESSLCGKGLINAFWIDVPSLHTSDEVISSNGWKGTVKEVGSRGTFSVYYPGSVKGNYVQSSANLARTHGESHGLCVGDHVISENGMDGKVDGVFPNGNVSVNYPGSIKGRYSQDPNHLARTIGKFNALRVGDRVVSNSGTGTVLGIYPDGNIIVGDPQSKVGRRVQDPDSVHRMGAVASDEALSYGEQNVSVSGSAGAAN